MESMGRSLRDMALAASPRAEAVSLAAEAASTLARTSSRERFFCMVMARRYSMVRRSQKWLMSGMVWSRSELACRRSSILRSSSSRICCLSLRTVQILEELERNIEQVADEEKSERAETE